MCLSSELKKKNQDSCLAAHKIPLRLVRKNGKIDRVSPGSQKA